MIKKVIIMLTAVIVCSNVMAANITNINMHDYGKVVTRIAIHFDRLPEQCEQHKLDSKTLLITYKNVSSNVKIPLEKHNGIVGNLTFDQDGSDMKVVINTTDSFEYKVFQAKSPVGFGYDIINTKELDSVTGKIAYVDYCMETGQYNSANKLLNQLTRENPRDYKLKLKLGKLLTLRHNFPKAKEVLASIPQTSEYYSQAQSIISPKSTPIAKSEQKVLPEKKEKPKQDKIAPLPQEKAQVETVNQDAAQAKPQTKTIPFIPKQLPDSKEIYSGIMKYIIYEVLLLIALVVAIIFIFKKRKPERKLSELEELPVDSETKLKLISKLLADGWNSKEIARELRISNSEVHDLIKLCQMSFYHDSNN